MFSLGSPGVLRIQTIFSTLHSVTVFLSPPLALCLATVFTKCSINTQEGGPVPTCLFSHSQDSWLSVIYQVSPLSKKPTKYNKYYCWRSGRGLFLIDRGYYCWLLTYASQLWPLYQTGWSGAGGLVFLFSKIPNLEPKCEMLKMAEQLHCKCNDTYIYTQLYVKMEVFSTSCFFQVIMQTVVIFLLG